MHRAKNNNWYLLTLIRPLEEEDNIIVKWAQEDVETLYNVIINK